MFEMLYGYPPFYAEEPRQTCQNVLHWRETLNLIPAEGQPPVSELARDLIRALMCSQEDRLGKNGVDEIKAHPFFEGIDWANLQNTPPPFVPELASETDTAYFAEFPMNLDELPAGAPSFAGKKKDKNWIGCTGIF